MLNSILPDVAKKEDIKELKNEITRIRGEMAHLRKEMYSNFKWTVGIILTIWGQR
ncbi:MAG: hypothetical protein QXX32_02540 [Thermofilum sp.]|uniref:hypothetical protein n=1 Tax=Thermofilum sp. TaxID=1961369 RepID=UPI0031600609